jgi:hypothetical protein
MLVTPPAIMKSSLRRMASLPTRRDDRAGRGARGPLEAVVAIEPGDGACEPDAFDSATFENKIRLPHGCIPVRRFGRHAGMRARGDRRALPQPRALGVNRTGVGQPDSRVR